MKPSLSRLLDDVLDAQDEPDIEFDDLAFADSIEAALANDGDLPNDAATLIWRSPSARQIYLRMRRERAATLQRRWEERKFSSSLERYAADSSQDSESFSTSEIVLRITRSLGSDQWLVSVQLEPSAREVLPHGVTIRVSDKGGLTWIEGRLDERGGLDAFWEHADETPSARARQHGLAFEFY